ncbi:MAG: hypothetical protein RBS77_03310 [Candidatus Moranbacteria bacterium]|jgi:hypothetical protein|nr:hypothetical protein [Candidatus Moranbacteria bacterium]
MPEEEIKNKIRLDQVRRAAIRARMDQADGIKPNMSAKEKAEIRKDKYGGASENKASKAHSGKFAKIAAPLAVAKKAKDMVMAPTEIRATDVLIYGLAVSLALFKDILDLAFIGSLPAIGTVITFCISIAIGFILLLGGVSVSRRKVARRMTRRFLILIAGTLVEGIFFGLNFFPVETMTVLIIYWMELADRKADNRANKQEKGNY